MSLSIKKRKLCSYYPANFDNHNLSIECPGKSKITVANPSLRLKSESFKKFKTTQGIKIFYGGISAKTYKQLTRNMKQKPLFTQLESRLDVIVFRLGFALSVFQARQLIRHGFVMVNGKLATSINSLVTVGELIQCTSDSSPSILFSRRALPNFPLPPHLKLISCSKGLLVSSPRSSAVRIPAVYEFA